MGLIKAVGKGIKDTGDKVASGTKDATDKTISGTKNAGNTIVNTGKEGARQGGKAVDYVGRKNGMSGDVSKFMLKKHGGKESFAKMGKKLGTNFFDPGTNISNYMYKMNLVGENDKADIKAGIDITYGSATGGMAPIGDAMIDSARRRSGKGKREENKQKTKARHEAKKQREEEERRRNIDRKIKIAKRLNKKSKK